MLLHLHLLENSFVNGNEVSTRTVQSMNHFAFYLYIVEKEY